MKSRYPHYKKTILLMMVGILCGCTIGKSYREINPEGAAEEVRQSNGYYALKSVSANKAKIVFRSEGAPSEVNVSSSTATSNCQDFTAWGTVKDAGHGIVYPWIARMAERTSRAKPFIETEIEPSRSIQIRGYGSWTSSGPLGFVSSGNCGPIVTKFTPSEGHAYLIRFIWNENNCKQVISDATNPDAPIDVPAETISSCPQP